MNQTDRVYLGKCVNCGRTIKMLDVYDCIKPEYITISLPYCHKCKLAIYPREGEKHDD